MDMPVDAPKAAGAGQAVDGGLDPPIAVLGVVAERRAGQRYAMIERHAALPLRSR